MQITLRIDTDDATLANKLVDSWINDRDIRIIAGGGQPRIVSLTYVKERDEPDTMYRGYKMSVSEGTGFVNIWYGSDLVDTCVSVYEAKRVIDAWLNGL